jgi:antagonist of KipI
VTGCFEVVEGGLQTTVQDLGRGGLLATGMPPSGAFDALALQQANLLVGNCVGDSFLVGDDPGDAGLEVLLLGPRLRFLRRTVLAITGAELCASLDGQPASMYEAIEVDAGTLLAFGKPQRGARAYVAFAGGLDVPLALGSRSTNVRAGIGGLVGRKLKRGDILATSEPRRPFAAVAGRSLRAQARRRLGPPWELRVVLGPQDDLFRPESVSLFLESPWRLSLNSDRMGCRFTGPRLFFKPRPDYVVAQAGADPSNIVDDAIPVGGIQVPSGVEAIAMGVDGPSLGGYAKIGTVISADLGRLAQISPGEEARFRSVTVEEAVSARTLQAQAHAEAALDGARSGG